MIKYYKVKGQLSETKERRVHIFLIPHCIKEFDNEYYSLRKADNVWIMTAKAGCGWDFATKFPDFKWIKEPSLWHDISHWLIAQGAISTEANDIIDEILADDCRKNSNILMAPIRNYYIAKATNTVDQEVGEQRKVYTA